VTAMKVGVVAIGLCAVSASTAFASGTQGSSVYFSLQLTKGATYRNVFSRTISIKGTGFKEIVQRVGGSSTYTVVDTDADQPSFQLSYRFDGMSEGAARVQMRDHGRVVCFDGKCLVDAETSGLTFDPLLWGMPPPDPKPGMTWRIRITQPWELGPPGSETVRVVSVDPANELIMLDREGSGHGQSDPEDLHTVTMTVGKKTAEARIVPGESHWSGQTVFRRGIILSDAFLLERPVTLVSKLGTFRGMERAYALLDAMPSSESAQR
jgi:hypothetical protein